MRRMDRVSLAAAAALALALAGGAAMAEDVFVQNQAHFRLALYNTSTSQSFVLVTVVDGRSGQRRTGCITGGALLHAIAQEEGIDKTDYHGLMLPDVKARVIAKALASKRHVYTFHKPAALAGVVMDRADSVRACEIIRAGLPAYRQDRTGLIQAGEPLEMHDYPLGRAVR